MKKLKLAYFGTPYFSAKLLEDLLKDTALPIEIKFVVTRPDKAVGRKQILTPSPVKQVALKYKIPVIDDLKMLKECGYQLQDLDFAFLYAYGAFIPNNLLNLPRLGFLNTHPSLLPKYRGPSPIGWPLILGDKETGVTFIRLDEKVDHGPIIDQVKTVISDYETRTDLETRLTNLAYKLFKKQVLP